MPVGLTAWPAGTQKSLERPGRPAASGFTFCVPSNTPSGSVGLVGDPRASSNAASYRTGNYVRRLLAPLLQQQAGESARKQQEGAGFRHSRTHSAFDVQDVERPVTVSLVPCDVPEVSGP